MGEDSGLAAHTEEMTQAQLFLDAAYDQLDFRRGDLVRSDLSFSDPEWVQKGDWAALAKHVGADRVFFVKENPVVVFAKHDSDDPEALRQLFRKVWCMSRPNLLFLASPGALAVYDLTKAPARIPDEWRKHEALDTVSDVSKVAERLKAYHRAQIETGKLFEERRFGTAKHRADKSLIQDLRTVRAGLITEGLANENLKYAHALIGRSIFIRYLEDRGVLTRKYFHKIAEGNRKWRNILESSSDTPYANPEMDEVCYVKVLESKEFTYALFRQLAEDFNGDMFPEDEDEEKVVTQNHLTLLQGFLRGDPEAQRKLFFWAYKFDIIPIELVSSIYEEFYTTQTGDKDGKGTHYTPSALVEFLLSQVLTSHCLQTNPVILDPACGSGIFLVEAFRRIVRYRTQEQRGRPLDAGQLRRILRNQIRGIDINPEAIRVAAFSLYLALLHYQEPKDILEQIEMHNRLPYLVKPRDGEPRKEGGEYLDILQAENAFSSKVDMKVKVDVVVGNPPWGDVSTTDKEGRAQAKVALEWCSSSTFPVGDRERSQAFIWRAMNLLKEGGSAGMLVSSGVLHKHSPKSKEFREKWLSEVSLEQVVHFAHVRHVFFPSANAPFASVVFRCSPAGSNGDTFMYASVKKTAVVDGTQSVILSKNDMHYVRQRDMAANDASWKILWWGNHHDKALIESIMMNTPLESIVDLKNSGQGFKKASAKKSAGWLSQYRELPLECVTRYGDLDLGRLRSVPRMVESRGVKGAYSGLRLLVRQGIRERGEPKGQVIARVVEEEFCFTNSINSIHLREKSHDRYMTILGILWSSLARYFLFLSSSSWGLWHNQLHLDEILSMPVRFVSDDRVQKEVLGCVGKLREVYARAVVDDLQIRALESQLDNAVFNLYELSESERDLVRDMCEVGIPFFYDPKDSRAACPVVLRHLAKREGRSSDLDEDTDDRLDIHGYLHVFLRIWNRELEPEAEFSWRVIAPGYPTPMLAVVLSTQNKGGAQSKRVTHSDEDEWRNLLRRLAEDVRVPFHSDRIYVDGIVRVVSPTQIVIIKRNEGRFWTRSAAREDAEATLLKAMHLDGVNGESV